MKKKVVPKLQQEMKVKVLTNKVRNKERNE